MIDQEYLQKLFELFTAVLVEVRAGQVKLERQLDKLTNEIRELREQQTTDSTNQEK